MCCKCCPISLTFSFSFWSDFSGPFTPTPQEKCAFLNIFSIAYCLQQHGALKQCVGWREAFLIQNLLWGSIFFLYSFARRNQITSPTDFPHSLLELFRTFAAAWFPDLHFPLILTKEDHKVRLPCKAESSKGFSSLSHGTFYFITFGSPRCHSQTWLIIMPHNTCNKWLNFLF